MRSKSKKFLFPIALLSLALALSSCTKQESEFVVNADGTMSGTNLAIIPQNVSGSFSGLDFVWDIQTPHEIINITFDSRDVCSATNAKFFVVEGAIADLNYATIRLEIANSDHSVYAYGDVSESSNVEGDTYVKIPNLHLIPKSGNNADCAYLDTINSGALALAPQNFSGDLGSLEFPVNVLQIANIPPAERLHYFLLSQIVPNLGDSEENARYPENHECYSFLQEERFDVLNDRQLMPGEFLELVRQSEVFGVKRTDTSWESSCSFSNIPLSALSRELPGDSDLPELDPSGMWRVASDDVTWDYLAETYDPNQEVQEINMDGVYSPEEMTALVFALETGYSTNMKISGVVLSTNGTLDSAKNSVSWSTSGVWGGSNLTIPGGADMREPQMNVLVGNTVSFLANKSTWSNATTFGGLKSKLPSLKKPSVDVIQIVGIKKFGLTGATATANLKIVKKRVTAIKNKLKAAKVKADIEVVYLTPNSITGGDSKYANKVVVRALTNGR